MASSKPKSEVLEDPWLEDLVKWYQPSCDCILGDEKKQSEPFYTHLGVAKTLPELRKVSH